VAALADWTRDEIDRSVLSVAPGTVLPHSGMAREGIDQGHVTRYTKEIIIGHPDSYDPR